MMPTEAALQQKIADAKYWPTELHADNTINTQHSKLVSSLLTALENGEVAYKHRDYQTAIVCFESAEAIARELAHRDWQDDDVKEQFETQTISAIQYVTQTLQELSEVSTNHNPA